jgi:GNAT superfamily N-acetyltransferase
MRQLLLKPAAPTDAPLLARIHWQARAGAMPWLPVLHTLEETESWLTNVVLVRQDVWTAVRDGITLGFVALTPAWVEQLYVDPAAWRCGVGSLLLDHAKRRQPGGFRLWTFQRNAMARSFYRKHGLIEIRMTDGYDNEEKEPDVLLGWKLTS